MSQNVGIWIDHKKAVIVSVSAARVSATTLESEVGPHPRYSGAPDGADPQIVAKVKGHFHVER
jgi:hypothetical protein